MKKHVLFIHGGGDNGYKEDAKLATSLQTLLGAAYHVQYPQMPSDESLPDFGWLQKIENEFTDINNNQVILVGHSQALLKNIFLTTQELIALSRLYMCRHNQ
jgi:uncharacterized protein